MAILDTASHFHIYSQKLWQCVQDLCKLKPDKTPAWREVDMKFISSFELVFNQYLLGEGDSFFFEGITHGR